MSTHGFAEEYRRCLERDCECSVPRICTDLKFKFFIRMHLEKDPELHTALLNRDALTVIENALVVHPDVVCALKSLVRAFEVLELAAVNLHCFPWRKEFCMIKMFSGGYVHNLKYIFSEEDLANLLSKMGYAKRTGDQCFQVTHLPSMSQLMLAACGFFAARVECEILSDIISGLDAFKVSATHLIQERRKNIGGVDGCIERLQTLSLNMARLEPKKAYVFQPTSYDFDGDIYTAGSANQAQHPYLHSDSLIGRKELSFQPLFTANPELNTFYTALSNCHGVPGSDKARGNGKDIDQQVQYDTGLKKSFTPEQTDLGFNSPFKNVDEANSSKSTGCKSPVAEICVTLSRGAAYKLHDCVIDTACLGYRCDSCQILHENMCKEVAICRSKYHPLNYIFSDEKDEILAELICQRYQAHSCIPKDALPCSRCDTCLVLHFIKCSAFTDCKTMKHAVHILNNENEQKLWLRRTKLDFLLGSGSWV